MKSSLDEAWAALAKSKEDMAQYYNQCWTPAPSLQWARSSWMLLTSAQPNPQKSSHIATSDCSLSFAQLVCMHITWSYPNSCHDYTPSLMLSNWCPPHPTRLKVEGHNDHHHPRL
jgi:hypothetical protein